MNWVDLVILAVILSFAVEGQRRGFFVQVFDIFGFAVSLLASLNFYPQSAQILIRFFNLPKIAANPVGFLLVWVVVETLFFSIFSQIFRKLIFKFARNPVNRSFGILPASANALLFLSFLLLFVVSLPIRPDIKKDVFDSKIGSVLVDKASSLEKPFNSIFGPIAKQSLTFLTVRPEEKGTIPLEFTQSQLTVDRISEQKMFDLVNQERIRVGVKPLAWNEEQAGVGRAHSKDMFERGYFSQDSPSDH